MAKDIIRLTVDLVVESGSTPDLIMALDETKGMIAGFAASVGITESGKDVGEFKVKKAGASAHLCNALDDKCHQCIEHAYDILRNLL